MKSTNRNKNSDSVINRTAELKKIQAIHKSTYVKGKDSELIVSGQLGKELYGECRYEPIENQILDTINKKYNWHYNSWEELSEKKNLTEKFINQYETYISWWHLFKAHPERKFSEDFIKKHPSPFILKTLGLV